MILDVKSVSKFFGGVKAIDAVSFSLEKGEILGIVGPNGSGKTTLLDVISGLSNPDSGEVRFNDIKITHCKAHEVAKRGLVRSFQSPRLFGNLTVLENMLMAVSHDTESVASMFSMAWKSKEQMYRGQALKSLEAIGLTQDKFRPATELSLGQMRRLELARTAMVENAFAYLYDEPTGGLDPTMIENTASLLTLLKQREKAVVVVEHNTDFIHEIADRVIVLDQGRKISEGKPKDVFRDPAVIAAYFGSGKGTNTCCSR